MNTFERSDFRFGVFRKPAGFDDPDGDAAPFSGVGRVIFGKGGNGQYRARRAHDDWRGRRVYRRLPDREPGFRSGRGGARRDFTEPDLRVFDDFAPLWPDDQRHGVEYFSAGAGDVFIADVF